MTIVVGESKHRLAHLGMGREPEADFGQVLAGSGALWLLVGVAYPGNIGMAIRTAEVSGADGIIVDAQLDHAARRSALANARTVRQRSLDDGVRVVYISRFRLQ